MRILIAVAILFTVACTTAKKEQPAEEEVSENLFTQLAGEWQMLTEWGDDQWVIYRPCDADNRMLLVYSDTLMIGWGQDASIGLIKSFYTEDDGRTVIQVQELDSGTSSTYIFRFEDETGRLARWWLFGDNESSLFVHEGRISEYSTYEQPCEECWDDCD